jgi:hypothetical protein
VTDKKLEGFVVRFLLRPKARKTGVWIYFNDSGEKINELEWTRNNHSEMQEKEFRILGF